MTIKTASLRDIKKLSSTAYKVLVTRYFPYYIKGIKALIDEHLPVLAPSKGLLDRYKNELKRTQDPRLAWSLSKYDKHFRLQILRGPLALAELKRIRDIGRRLKGKRVVYLICHEAVDDYCHRRILKELMERYEL